MNHTTDSILQALDENDSILVEELISGYSGTVIGVDEVGFGAIAGPVTVCAFSIPLDEARKLQGESKGMSESKRERYYRKLQQVEGRDYSICSKSNDYIDSHGLGVARKQAIKESVKSISQWGSDAGHVLLLLDGDPLSLDIPGVDQVYAIPKGDERSSIIGAASVIAKVTRDKKMVEHAKEFPQYDWSSNKGYGTKTHMEALRNCGPCRLHRFSTKSIRKLSG